jgi:hypothetical protein
VFLDQVEEVLGLSRRQRQGPQLPEKHGQQGQDQEETPAPGDFCLRMAAALPIRPVFGEIHRGFFGFFKK